MIGVRVDNKRGILYIDTSLLSKIEGKEFKIAATNPKGEVWHKFVLEGIPILHFAESYVVTAEDPFVLIPPGEIIFGQSYVPSYSETLELNEIVALPFQGSYISSFSGTPTFTEIGVLSISSSYIAAYSEEMPALEINGIGGWAIGTTFEVA